MNRDAAGTDFSRVFGVPQMMETLQNAGWTGSDLKRYAKELKSTESGFKKLDEFADGELSALKGSPLYIVMLEVTAIRYVLEQSKPGHGGAPIPEDAHEVA